MKRIFSALLLSSFCVSMTSCFLFEKKKKSKKSGGLSLIDRESIYIDRIGDGNSAIIKFNTYRDAFCELAVYAQDEKSTPTRENPQVTTCSGADAARKEFREQVKDWHSDTLYFIEIRAWLDKANPAARESLVVKENPDDSSINPGTSFDGKYRETYVLRFNTPLRTAEIHRHVFPSPVDSQGIKAATAKSPGCANSVPENIGPFSAADPMLKIKSLGSKGFAQGTGESHPNFPERVRFNFNTLQFPNPEWELTWDLEGKSQSLKIRPAPRFTSVEATSAKKIVLGEAQLATPEEPLQLENNKSLTFAWQWENLPDNAIVTAQIGRTGQEKSVYCVFEAKKGSGEIPWASLATLPPGLQVVLLQLEATQFFATKSWLTQSIDWRSTRIEKL